MDHASHLDHAFLAAAIEQKMTRRLDARPLHSAPAERKMVGVGAFDRDLRACQGSGPFGIFADIAQCLGEKRFIAERSPLPELLFGPVQNGAYVAPRFMRDADLEWRPALRHDAFQPRARPMLLPRPGG